MTKPQLYHATCAARNEDGKYIVFPTRLDPKKQRTVIGEMGEFVFAGPNLPIAVAYALKSRSEDRHIAKLDSCGSFPNKVPFGIVYGYKKFLTHPAGKIFAVSNDSFEPVLKEDKSQTGEWISKEPVFDIKAIKSVTPEFAMRAGVQIFIHLDRDSRTLYAILMGKRKMRVDEMVEKIKLENLSPDEEKRRIDSVALETHFAVLRQLIKSGHIIHLNRERNINPMDLTTGAVADRSFIENPQKILDEPAKSVEATGGKRLEGRSDKERSGKRVNSSPSV